MYKNDETRRNVKVTKKTQLYWEKWGMFGLSEKQRADSGMGE